MSCHGNGAGRDRTTATVSKTPSLAVVFTAFRGKLQNVNISEESCCQRSGKQTEVSAITIMIRCSASSLEITVAPVWIQPHS
ncbi:hypothetical protein F2P79_000585 [Pimephales promelas]|nr:hypothetical protein F2P79_000585 [Pimephales promelas]